ncbi:MAG: RNA 2'-phosphotransferase [Clostridiales bacterium]|nr:RNA 2'-phosphotransferase [Clostridiales bacterium]
MVDSGSGSLILRHKPEVIGITLDEHGWANVDELIAGINQTRPLTMETLEQVMSPEILYHGIGEKSVALIDIQGLLPMSRLYVHLSGDHHTARKVGQRHGRPVIYRVFSGKMSEDGIPFCRGVNGVWLTKAVPVKYLEKMSTEEK